MQPYVPMTVEAERTRVSPGRLLAWVLLVGTISAIEYDARLTGANRSASTHNAVFSYSAFVGGVAFYTLILVAVLAIAAGRNELFALRRPTHRPALAAVLVFVGVYAFEIFVVTALPIRNPGKEQGLTPSHWESAHAGAFAVNLLLFVVYAPIVEELTFRGLGQSLLQFAGRWPSILLIGVMFGLWHGLVQALVVLIPFGTALAYLRDRTTSVYPGMIVHGAFNALALIAAVLSG
jgi:membrane protease YdiL (CAAX protease family)